MARRYTPAIVTTADQWERQAFACMPEDALTQRIETLARELNDPAVTLTKAQREHLNRLGDVLEDALRERRRTNAMAAFVASQR